MKDVLTGVQASIMRKVRGSRYVALQLIEPVQIAVICALAQIPATPMVSRDVVLGMSGEESLADRMVLYRIAAKGSRWVAGMPLDTFLDGIAAAKDLFGFTEREAAWLRDMLPEAGTDQWGRPVVVEEGVAA